MIFSLDLTYLLLFFLLVFGFAFGWNNSGLTTGNLSNIVNYNLALILTVSGAFVGVLVLGGSMSSSIIGKLVSSSIPLSSILAAVIASTALLIVLTLMQLPVSLSNCVVGSFIGAALASHSAVSTEHIVEIGVSWVAAPLLCAGVTVLAYRLVLKVENNAALTKISRINRILLVISVFYVSFGLGGNNIGVIVSFAKTSSLAGSGPGLELLVFVASSLGMVLFGKSIAKIVGDKIVDLSQIKALSAMLGCAIITTVFTVISIPLSLTQVIIGGMIGAGAANRPSVINNRELVELISGWLLATLVSVGLGYGLAYFILG